MPEEKTELTKVVFRDLDDVYDINYFELTPSQVRLLKWLDEKRYITDDCTITFLDIIKWKEV